MYYIILATLLTLFTCVQYYVDRKNLALVGKGDLVEEYNRVALKIAREVAEERGLLFAGGISDTCIFSDSTITDPEAEVRSVYKQQVQWAKEEGADYVIAETISYFKEAKIALEVIQSFDLPAVVTLRAHGPDKNGLVLTSDGVPIADGCRQLVDLGATLVGSNCHRGPATMIKLIEDIVKVVPPEKVCALPVGFRTTNQQPTWFDFKDEGCPENNPPFGNSLNPFSASEAEIIKFTKHCQELGLKYMGICCGNTGSMTRVMATTLGKKPIQNKYHDIETINQVVTYKKKMLAERVKELTK